MRSSVFRRRSSNSKNTHERSGDAVIDCSTFHNCEVDALYEAGAARELDDGAAAALEEHAQSCPECAARIERLRANRRLVLSVAVEAVPRDFESRIMAAVDAALAKRAVLAVAPALSSASGGATILRFMARPSFAVAATFVLVLSGATFMMTRNSSPTAMNSLASSDEAFPAAAPMAAASGVTIRAVPVPAERGIVAQATTTATPPAAVAMAPAAPDPSPIIGARMAKPAVARAGDPALDTAKALSAQGRCNEALPKLEALSATTPEADFYAARCIAKTRGCAAAEPRFDRAAQTNAGTEVGSRAQLEGAKCYQSTGDVVAARKRYVAAKDEGLLSAEASQALDELDSHATAKPGTAGAGAHASPKAMAAPRAADPAASPPAER